MDASSTSFDSSDLKALWHALSTRSAVPFRALGNSMMPLYPSGTLFLLERYEGQKLVVGDLVLLEVNNTALLHRIINIQSPPGPTITTKGDANPYPEGPYPLSHVRALATHLVKDAQFKPLNSRFPRIKAQIIAQISYSIGVINRVLRKLGIGPTNRY